MDPIVDSREDQANAKRQFSVEDESWMRQAFEEARLATEYAEVPIAAILVDGNNNELARAQTQAKRRGTLVAHGELLALLDLGPGIWSATRPVTLYTTVEPCSMCLGAAAQVQVDRIVYSMKAEPDGGTYLAAAMKAAGQFVPMIDGGLLLETEIEMMEQYLVDYPDEPAAPYVVDVLKPYVDKLR